MRRGARYTRVRSSAASDVYKRQVGHHLHEVGGGDDRPFSWVEDSQDVRPLFRLGGMKAVPALNGQAITPQFVVTGYAPDVGLHTVLFSENVLRAQRFIQDGPAAKQLQRGFTASRRFVFVDAAQNSLLAARRHFRHRIIFVVQGDVVKAVFELLV